MASSEDGAFPIVGIGASAGGVEALEGLFRDMPPETGCGFVIVTHLNPERRSLLPQIVARYTQMPVHVAEDGAMVQPNAVYVLPADAVLSIAERRLLISSPEGGRRPRKPIDIFFSALAKDQGEYAAGVILSGGDGDGTLGVKSIKERGGLTLAQVADGTAPQYPDMPDSAIASGMIDLAISVSEMGSRLAEFARSFALLDGLKTRADAPTDAELLAARREICEILRNQIGHDFGGYKAKTFLRRVQRRMQVHRIEALDAYTEKLRQDPQEVGALFRDLLINVTNFFRDADAFEMLAGLVIPKLFEGRGADDTVRVWVPGCATGEEVFSIAMLMREHMDGLTAVPRVQIFATDIDERALSVARAARYPDALLDSVSLERRKRFFIPDGGSYVVSKEVRDLCVFSPHSVIRDPPFSRLDMVSCRNLLIYFGPDVQSQVIPTFHYALRPGGYLFLGTSENVTQFGDLFIALDKKHRIFRSRENVSANVRVPLTISGLRPAPFAMIDPMGRKGAMTAGSLRTIVEQQVLDRFAPAHVAVTREGDIVHFSARTGKYLEASSGAPSRQLLTMARKGLRLDLRALLREAVETERRVQRENLAVEGEDDRVQLVTVTIEPLVERGADPLFLLTFNDIGPSLSREEAMARVGSPDETTAHLERELRETRERLQSLIEEYETALEELKSSNEELVSVNEELQSTNEELEASKEELQSVNEELHTVNAELIGKVEALDCANSDLQNLFESTQVATVFLDQNLVIRSFTPAMTQIFNILPGDRGRPLTDLASRLSLPTLTEDVRSVHATGQVIERSIEHEGGAFHFLARLAPYHDADRRIGGVVATFVDVTSLTEAEAQQQVLINELNHRVKNMLAVVIGIVDQLAKSAPGATELKDAVVDRLHAMARSHELLSQENWTEASILDLIKLEFAPFGIDRVDLHGADVRLAPPQAVSLGMVLHELATNASKYGALAIPGGRVLLNWTVQDKAATRALALTWQEQGGPPVQEPAKRGFGRKLVEREIRQTLGGETKIVFGQSGVVVELSFPMNGKAPARN